MEMCDRDLTLHNEILYMKTELFWSQSIWVYHVTYLLRIHMICTNIPNVSALGKKYAGSANLIEIGHNKNIGLELNSVN